MESNNGGRERKEEEDWPEAPPSALTGETGWTASNSSSSGIETSVAGKSAGKAGNNDAGRRRYLETDDAGKGHEEEDLRTLTELALRGHAVSASASQIHQSLADTLNEIEVGLFK